MNEEQLLAIAKRIASRVGRRVDELFADGRRQVRRRRPCEHRLIPPISLDGTSISLFVKFREQGTSALKIWRLASGLCHQTWRRESADDRFRAAVSMCYVSVAVQAQAKRHCLTRYLNTHCRRWTYRHDWRCGWTASATTQPSSTRNTYLVLNKLERWLSVS